ncbi:MAG: 1-acyl-sn-glycerol-3-phosphate acyltransferase [Anaerolineae bacterium]|nr:1-acyl-sn-glycerol-3-phosphate acyltransferase [Anaerolineae bacterium]
MTDSTLVHPQAIPRYRFPLPTGAALLWSAITLRPRSFARDAGASWAGISPAPVVVGVEYIPTHGPCLVVCNHYSRPGFAAWWIALAITAVVSSQRSPKADREIHWVMTAAWTFPESAWRRRLLTPATRWAFARIAQVYGFVTMPPMPPAPDEVEARAMAVLRTLRLARQLAPQGGMIGLAPEGQDFASGGIGQPPTGAGEFIALLVQAGLSPVLPIGVSECDGRLRLSCGPPFTPLIPLQRAERDRAVISQVMDAIGAQLS